MPARFVPAAVLALMLAPLAPAADAPKKVVVIAGKKSHGPVGNGIHDYGWSAKLIKAMLESSQVRDRVAVEVHLDGWPKDPAALDAADAVMVISDGREGSPKEGYEPVPHFATPENAAAMAKQIKRGCGFLTFHFSTFAPDRYEAEILDWCGGYFDWQTDGKQQYYSTMKTVEADVRVEAPDHPVCRGVNPFRMKEEFYYNIRFRTNDRALTPLLTVPELPGREPDGKTVAWVRERADGGRGFGTTAGHFYANWKNDDFRRFMLNAVVWAAKAEVPKEGVTAKFLTHEEIDAALKGK
jgi:type 1 glutamine amidotransferase